MKFQIWQERRDKEVPHTGTQNYEIVYANSVEEQESVWKTLVRAFHDWTVSPNPRQEARVLYPNGRTLIRLGHKWFIATYDGFLDTPNGWKELEYWPVPFNENQGTYNLYESSACSGHYFIRHVPQNITREYNNSIDSKQNLAAAFETHASEMFTRLGKETDIQNTNITTALKDGRYSVWIHDSYFGAGANIRMEVFVNRGHVEIHAMNQDGQEIGVVGAEVWDGHFRALLWGIDKGNKEAEAEIHSLGQVTWEVEDE